MKFKWKQLFFSDENKKNLINAKKTKNYKQSRKKNNLKAQY